MSAGGSRRRLQRRWIDPGDGVSDADGQAETDLHALRLPTSPQGNVVSKGVNELIIRNYKQAWGNIRKIADVPEVTRKLTFKSQEYRTS